MVDKNSNCVFSGKDVEIPFGYITFELKPSGFKKSDDDLYLKNDGPCPQ